MCTAKICISVVVHIKICFLRTRVGRSLVTDIQTSVTLQQKIYLLSCNFRTNLSHQLVSQQLLLSEILPLATKKFQNFKEQKINTHKAL